MQPKIVHSSDTLIWLEEKERERDRKNMGLILTHLLRCRRWKVCWFGVVNPVLVQLRGQNIEVSDPAQFSLFIDFTECYTVTIFPYNFFSFLLYTLKVQLPFAKSNSEVAVLFFCFLIFLFFTIVKMSFQVQLQIMRGAIDTLTASHFQTCAHWWEKSREKRK